MRKYETQVHNLANLAFLNCHPRLESLRDNVLSGLAARPRRIASKFLYDERGSELFDKICKQPEYYQTDAELEILEQYAGEMVGDRPGRTLLIELGSGHSRKIRKLLGHLKPGSAYVPLDISSDYLISHAAKIAKDHPELQVTAICADFLQPVELPGELALERGAFATRIVFFPGSTLGNFEPETQLRILANARRLAGERGRLIIGVDRKNPRAMLEAAYNDQAGATAEFELNLLTRINREMNADFNPEGFSYRGFYNAEAGRIEMYLVSDKPQKVCVDGRGFYFDAGETIHVENSYKYEPAEFEALCARAGLRLQQTWTDKQERFNVYLATGLEESLH